MCADYISLNGESLELKPLTQEQMEEVARIIQRRVQIYVDEHH